VTVSQENVEIVRAGFEAWKARSTALFDQFAPDIEWEVRPDLPDATTYRGLEGVQEMLSQWMAVIGDMWFEPEDYIEAGDDQVVVPLRWGGTGKGSGAPFEEQKETWLFTVRDGKVTRIKEFATREAAFEAAGLSR
jgi:ketosteroid isomerase-like protein